MELYLLKSTTCLAILFSFYKLFLENETTHTFKRFYLLGSLLLSFGIPLLTFTSYIESSSTIAHVLTSEVIASEIIETTNYLPYILWTLYGLGVLFFSLKFFRNLRNIIQKIKDNPKFKMNHITNVLLNDPVTPHTFFSYIFLNKQKFEAREIPSEVIIHEETHAMQKHSLDVLFIELLQIVFWFNPLIHLTRQSIKLNHEFLADRAVLEKGVETVVYQKLLIAFSSNAFSPQLANSINYSSIKKRITVMKTHSSKRSNFVRTLILLPLVALLVFGFSSREIVPTEESGKISLANQEKATPKQVAEYNKLAKKYNSQDDTNRFIQKSEVDRLKYLYNLMSAKQMKNAEPFPNFPPPPPKAPKAPKPVKEVKGVNGTNANIPPPPPPAADENSWKHEDQDTGIPPPPPMVSLEPLDHIVRMAHENAAFFYENKRISSDEAITLIKKNESLNIETETFKASNPIVKITKKGVTIEK